MNREQKLALVIGFALVLVVGVLISDHLSKAQMAELDNSSILSMRPSERVAQSNVPPLPPGWALDVTMPEQDRGAQRRDIAQREETRSNMPLRIVDPVRVAQAPADQVLVPQVSRPAESRYEPRFEQQNEPVVIALGRDGPWAIPQQPEVGTSVAAAHHSLLDTIREFGGEIRNGLVKLPDLPVAGRLTETQGRNASASSAPSTSSAASQTQAPAATEQVRVHMVQPNESLYKIAERYYGDGNLWRALAAHNKGRVGDDGSVRVGVRLEVPARLGGTQARPNVQQQSQPIQPRTPQTAPAPRSEPKPEPRAEPLRSYTVVRGDTLGQISTRLLGTSRRMNEIIAANRDQIDNADQILVGMTLKIPVR